MPPTYLDTALTMLELLLNDQDDCAILGTIPLTNAIACVARCTDGDLVDSITRARACIKDVTGWRICLAHLDGVLDDLAGLIQCPQDHTRFVRYCGRLGSTLNAL